MIKIFTRDMGEIQITKNFKAKEFFCKCGKCHNQIIDVLLVTKLQILRERLDKSIKINCGYRCEEHNKNVGGVVDSQHCKGTAADIHSCYADDAEIVGFNGIGTYRTFTHVDVREGKKSRWSKK